ncbi:hypothetical protein GCM10010981_31360 [Dyella nitratireducens]|uniref:Uncharacterized protein n=2 Tax=Dyella nitratireducens TaxID=1849580 RepID=A0ABQ1GAD9_9GAMM|nr:hypothetical protein GCM10010981_31360 [Dyella nitratireducens]GLQ40493.1 hypothetical protein GCM10007902_03420 [Dyella nitratireducens]
MTSAQGGTRYDEKSFLTQGKVSGMWGGFDPSRGPVQAHLDIAA